MATLHIEHPITDYPTWRTAFDQFAAARQSAGVTTHRVQRPVDDERYVVVDLDFPTVEQAVAFRQFLRDVVWSTPAASPALAGKPRAVVLNLVD